VARPVIALAAVVVVLAPLAVSVLQLHTSGAGLGDLPPGSPVRAAQRAIERAFPGGSLSAQIVVSGEHLDLATAGARGRLEALGERAIRETGGSGTPGLRVSRDAHVAEIDVPLPGNGTNERTIDALHVLRGEALPAARAAFHGAAADLTGAAAAEDDFNTQMRDRAPVVIGFVLALGFGLLLLAFGSVALAAAVLALNLLSVGAAFGALVLIFQHSWAQGLLGFTSNGAVVSWLPLFAFAVLFGLSMDYTVLVVARILEGKRHGLPARRAAAEGVAATAGVVSSAALVMVAVFSVFATLSALEFKQTGVGLALAILIDATLVRGIALPAAITLVADRSWGRRGRPPAESQVLGDAMSSGA
jgi:RND superfamily putative drug exporter